MKIKFLSYAVAAALAAGAGSAFALPPGSPINLVVNISGSSAQDGAIEQMFLLPATGVCVAGTADVYHFTNDNNHRLTSCTLNNAAPVPAALRGLNVMVRKASNGGSGNGVQPVANGTAVGQASYTEANFTAANCPGAAGTIHTCNYTDSQDSVVPDAGLSDEEPALFGATPAQLANLTAQSQAGVIFGIPVTLNLRNALQAAQGLTVGSDLETNMPTLSKTLISGIFSGTITDWSQVLDKNLQPLTSSSLVSGAGVAFPAHTSIYIDRRVDSSGTQHGARVYFLNDPCTPGATQPTAVLQFVAPTDGSDATNGGACNPSAGTVNAGSGSGDVAACMNVNNTAGNWAIGIEGLDVQPKIATLNTVTPGDDGYRFIKINGVSPNLVNVEEGRYDYYMENSIQWRSGPGLVNSSAPALSGNALALMQLLANEEASPAVVKAIDSVFKINQDNVTNGGAYTAFMALPTVGTNTPPTITPGSTPTQQMAAVLANPVAAYTKSPTGITNNCQPPVPAFPTAPF